MRLCGGVNPSTPASTPSGHDVTTPRQDQETHIAFGTKVVIPPHLRRNSCKENREASKIPHNSRLSSSRTKQSDIRYTNDDLVMKSPLSPKGNEDRASGDSTAKGIDVNQATIQPRPPRTSSAGKIRRPFRLKSSSAGKTRNAVDTDEKQPESLETEITQKLTEEKNVGATGKADSSIGMKTSGVTNVQRPGSQSVCDNSVESVEVDEELNMLNIGASGENLVSDLQKLTEKQRLDNGTEAITLSDAPTKKTSIKSSDDVKLFLGGSTNGHNEIKEENSSEKAEQKADVANVENHRPESISKKDLSNSLVQKSIHKRSLDVNTSSLDVNNNEPSTDKDSAQPRIRPRKLPLASNNPVFTFASMPRSPRSGKRKLLESPMVDDVITPSVEATPEVKVSLADDTPVKNGAHSNRGASLEDDFCKLSGK